MGRGRASCPGLLWELQCRCMYGLWQLSSAAVPHSQPHPHPSISIFSGQIHVLSSNSCIPWPETANRFSIPAERSS